MLFLPAVLEREEDLAWRDRVHLARSEGGAVMERYTISILTEAPHLVVAGLRSEGVSAVMEVLETRGPRRLVCRTRSLRPSRAWTRRPWSESRTLGVLL
jgi:hypothetical protein